MQNEGNNDDERGKKKEKKKIRLSKLLLGKKSIKWMNLQQNGKQKLKDKFKIWEIKDKILLQTLPTLKVYEVH